MERALKWIAAEYHDLNGIHYDTLEGPPSSLDFSRLVHVARPVVIKNCSLPGYDTASWTNEFLIQQMGDRNISVAATPNGHADAVTLGSDGRLYFAEPHTQKMTMAAFLSSLSSDPSDARKTSSSGREVLYLQSQNGNMYTSRYFDLNEEYDPSEFSPLREYVPSEVPWCSEAIDKPPDAVNLWIGNERSVTSIHSDPYENIYTVVRGAKHFTLLPPTEGWCLKERLYPHAAYIRSPTTSELELLPSPSGTPPVRWSSIIDPIAPGALPPEAHPIHITVKAGESMYLPAGWWHHVRQSGVTVAVNYWYDMESRGMSWVWLNFLRGLEEPPPGNDKNLECEG